MTTTLTTTAPRSSLGQSSFVQHVIGITRHSPTFTAGVIIVLIFAVVAFIAPLLAPYSPTRSFPDAVLSGPSAAHWFGTDGNGMDVFSRVLYGCRYAFGIAIPALLLMLIIGVPAGLVAGYLGGLVDDILLRTFDIFRAFPTIVLALAVVAATGQSLSIVVHVLGCCLIRSAEPRHRARCAWPGRFASARHSPSSAWAYRRLRLNGA